MDINYEIHYNEDSGFCYRDYENKIFLGFPKKTVERSINHEVLHHVFFHLINSNGFKYSAMKFDWISGVDCPWDDVEWLRDVGLPIWRH